VSAKTKAGRRRAAHQPRPLRRIPPQSDVFVGKLNVYQCPLGHPTVTVDRDAGVTPGAMPCPHTEARGFPVVLVACELTARSAWYRVPPDLTPTHEWYRPGDDERRGLSTYSADHVDKGGLLIRPVTTAADAEPVAQGADRD
jgi:hypothetical protein